MVNVIPSEKNMFRLIIRNRGSRVIRSKHNDPAPLRSGSWLRQVGIVAASVLFLPVALFSVAVFIGLFLAVLIGTLVYGLWLRSKFQRMESSQTREDDYEDISDADNQQKLP